MSLIIAFNIGSRGNTYFIMVGRKGLEVVFQRSVCGFEMEGHLIPYGVPAE